MKNEQKKEYINFMFECEQCAESWSENLLDLIDKCTTEELINLFRYIQNKLEEKD
ncbi:MAG: hypothetical protein ACFE9C_15080 [Candidatus Hodarchaeota archaeon]